MDIESLHVILYTYILIMNIVIISRACVLASFAQDCSITKDSGYRIGKSFEANFNKMASLLASSCTGQLRPMVRTCTQYYKHHHDLKNQLWSFIDMNLINKWGTGLGRVRFDFLSSL